MDPKYLTLMSSLKGQHDTISCFAKALTKYHLACARAAEQLAKDLAKCAQPPRRPVGSKK